MTTPGWVEVFSRQTSPAAQDTTTPEYSATVLIDAAISDKAALFLDIILSLQRLVYFP
jgi:hypothetical protein